MSREHCDPSFASEDRLFHYTSAQGLFGILADNCLWSTHYRFLNDSKEFLAAREPLIEILSTSIAKGLAAEKVNRGMKFKEGFDFKKEAYAEAARLIGLYYDHIFSPEKPNFDPYVFSAFVAQRSHSDFQNGGLLHWATYGRRGGYAIQLNPHKLDAKLHAEAERLAFAHVSNPAVYDTASIPKGAFGDAIASIEEFGRKHAKRLIAFASGSEEDTHRSEDVAVLAKHFLNLVAVIKDPYFKSESEARIVIYRVEKSADGKPSHPVYVRHRGATPVPYIRILKDSLLDLDGPLERIILGPHPDNERRKFALDVFLRSRGLSDRVEVSESKVPFIDSPF